MTANERSELRYPGLDAMRGCAVLAMVFYHFLFDLKAFTGNLEPRWIETLPDGFWRIVPAVIAAAFYWVAGFSASLRYEKVGHRFKPFLTAGAKLLLCALI